MAGEGSPAIRIEEIRDHTETVMLNSPTIFVLVTRMLIIREACDDF